MPDDDSTPPASAVRRLASWLRHRARTRPSASAGAPPDRAAGQAPPPSRLRPQPEDDASVYPLF